MAQTFCEYGEWEYHPVYGCYSREVGYFRVNYYGERVFFKVKREYLPKGVIPGFNSR